MFRVRLAKPEEEPCLQELEKILNLETPGLRSSETWVLDDGGKLIGMARITDLGPGYFLSSVGIIQPSRGQGLGRKLVLRLLEAKKKPVYLYTIIPEFFQRLGFEACSPPPFLPPKSLFSCQHCQPELCLCLMRRPTRGKGREARTGEGRGS